MATGSSTYDGLAMGLFGEWELTQQIAATDFLTLTGASSQAGDFLVLRNSSGTEQLWIDSVGTIKNRSAATSGNAYVGIDCRGVASEGGTAGFYATAGFRLTDYSDEAGVNQLYPGLFYFVGVSCATMSGGRVAGITIQFNMAADYDGIASTNCSFINFSDSSTQNVPSLFTFPGMTTASDIFSALSTTASTHALKINIGDGGGNDYYIMLTSCAP